MLSLFSLFRRTLRRTRRTRRPATRAKHAAKPVAKKFSERQNATMRRKWGLQRYEPAGRLARPQLRRAYPAPRAAWTYKNLWDEYYRNMRDAYARHLRESEDFIRQVQAGEPRAVRAAQSALGVRTANARALASAMRASMNLGATRDIVRKLQSGHRPGNGEYDADYINYRAAYLDPVGWEARRNAY